jgi:hypothetical protein
MNEPVIPQITIYQEISAEVRVKDGVLQQKFLITEGGGYQRPVICREEWRDVEDEK